MNCDRDLCFTLLGISRFQSLILPTNTFCLDSATLCVILNQSLSLPRPQFPSLYNVKSWARKLWCRIPWMVMMSLHLSCIYYMPHMLLDSCGLSHYIFVPLLWGKCYFIGKSIETTEKIRLRMDLCLSSLVMI